ncbi:MAG TPA: hypothetical protein VGB61_04525, partial [Pyrinomonadaceae bacterium]
TPAPTATAAPARSPTPAGGTGGAATPPTTPTATPPVVVTTPTTSTPVVPVAPVAPPNPLVPVRTFAFYALGFSLSGVLNLIAFSLLVANYTRTQSRTSRSIIDFLYGSDKAQVIDGYFLKSFVADPNYAKTNLVAALSAYRDLVRKEFAEAMNRRKDLPPKQPGTDSRPEQTALTPPPTTPPASPDPARPGARTASTPLCEGDEAGPFDYYELLAVRSTMRSDQELLSSTDVPKSSYEIVYRKLKGKKAAEEGKPGEPGDPITAEMFRVAISMRWQDNIEYVVTSGEYRRSFPYYGSVAGLSLLVRKPIVMSKDKYKRFRTSAYPDGRTPSQADQPRGLYEIDFLSYIAIPMMSCLGQPDEQSLGVLHIDTKLFACPVTNPPKDAYLQADTDSEIYRIQVEGEDQKKLEENLGKRLDEFEGYACNLYRQDDPIIKDLEKMKDVIIPLLELYKKCRTGVINQTPTTTAANTTPPA